MNVLSLFDGMGCCHIALNELGIKVDKYYASEVDKYAIQQTKLNFPDIVHLGSVTDVDVSKLEHIDLLAGGSPCQSFSFAGKRNGMSTTDNVEIYTLQKYMKLKEHGFEFDGESYLFWEYMRILTDIRKYNPDVLFLLENVEMGKKWERILSEAIGVYGVHINSALVSAQNRKRIFWTNIRTRPEGFFGDLHSDIPLPADRGILLKDILETEVDEKYYLSEKVIDRIQASYFYNDTRDIHGKSKCITVREGSQRNDANYIVAMRGRGENNEQQLEPQPSGKTNALTSVQKDNLVMQLNPSKESNGCQPYQQNRIYDIDGKSPALNAQLSTGSNLINTNRIRRLTPTECARLQTIPNWYKWESLIKSYYGYTNKETKKIEICEQNVISKIASHQFQTNQQDYVINIIYDLLEPEQPKEKQSIDQKNVMFQDVIDTQLLSNTGMYALCTISDFIGVNHLNFQSFKKRKGVNIVIEKLETEDLSECVQIIIEASNYMEMHLLLMKENYNQKCQLKATDIMGVRIKKKDTNQQWKVILGESLKEEKLYIILILINWIIQEKIYTYVKHKLNIQFYIESLKGVVLNCLNLDISNLIMEDIRLTSETQQYKMLGNGWNIETIVHILKFINHE